MKIQITYTILDVEEEGVDFGAAAVKDGQVFNLLDPAVRKDESVTRAACLIEAAGAARDALIDLIAVVEAGAEINQIKARMQ